MSSTENKSEVARLLQQISQEYEAARLAITGPAKVASHASITARTERIARYQEKLAQQVGQQEACRLVSTLAEEKL